MRGLEGSVKCSHHIGGRRKCKLEVAGEKVISDQLSVFSKSRKELFFGRLCRFRSKRNGGAAELLTAARVERIRNPTPDPRECLSWSADEVPLAPGERFVHW